MARGRSVWGVAALAVGGALAGYAAERALLRRVRPPVEPADVPLGSLAGELRELDGPRGSRISVESYGPDDAPQLVLVHGWIATGRVWHEQVAGLADRYRIVTYDQPGHGRSSAPVDRDYDLDLLGDTLRTVVEHATRPGPLVLAGHSLGGMTVLNAIRRHHDVLDERLAGVALMATMSRARAGRAGVEAGLRGAVAVERAARRLGPVLRRPGVAGLTRRLTPASTDLSYLVARALAVGSDASPDIVAFVEEQAVASDPDIVFGLSEAVFGVDEDLGLASLTVPTAIIVGAEDRLTPPRLARRMADRSVDAVLVELPGVGHTPQLEAPDTVNRFLERLLEQDLQHAVA